MLVVQSAEREPVQIILDMRARRFSLEIGGGCDEITAGGLLEQRLTGDRTMMKHHCDSQG